MSKENIVRCPSCKHEKELFLYVSMKKDNVYQDDTGKWTVCNQCNNTYHVEYYHEY